MLSSGAPEEIRLELHHIGFVVGQIRSSIQGFESSLGAVWDGSIFNDPKQKVKVAFLSTQPSHGRIELVEPASEDSPVAKFLRERGGGLHHLCYEVRDLEQALAAFKLRGAVIAKRPLPAVAFDGRRIAWILTAEKLLVELLEADKA
ncbi:MAG TPA: VOC family protein [Bryobacteraceae bacterium]